MVDWGYPNCLGNHHMGVSQNSVIPKSFIYRWISHEIDNPLENHSEHVHSTHLFHFQQLRWFSIPIHQKPCSFHFPRVSSDFLSHFSAKTRNDPCRASRVFQRQTPWKRAFRAFFQNAYCKRGLRRNFSISLCTCICIYKYMYIDM